MLRKAVLAVIVGIIVTLVCVLLGSILTSVADPTSVLTTIGRFLKDYGALIGLLSGLWYYFAGGPLLPPAS